MYSYTCSYTTPESRLVLTIWTPLFGTLHLLLLSCLAACPVEFLLGRNLQRMCLPVLPTSRSVSSALSCCNTAAFCLILHMLTCMYMYALQVNMYCPCFVVLSGTCKHVHSCHSVFSALFNWSMDRRGMWTFLNKNKASVDYFFTSY